MDRRSLLRGLVAAPAIVAIDSLMPIRGIIMPVRKMLTEDITVYVGCSCCGARFSTFQEAYDWLTESVEY